MCTTTGASALAVPVNDGVRCFDGVTSAFSVTVGGLVSTVKLTGELVPGPFPSELGSTAIAVYSPSVRAGADDTGPQLPAPLTGASAVATGLPVVFLPAKTFTVTGSLSLAVPLNDGVVSLDGELGPLIVTSGGSVLTWKRTSAVPSPGSSACWATAVYLPAASLFPAVRLHVPPSGSSSVFSVSTSGPAVPAPS